MKKTLIALLLSACLSVCAFGFTGCDENAALDAAYQAYVAAVAEGETPLTYAEWLASIKDASNFGEDVDELKAVYDTYAAAYGENAISYDDWKAAVNAVATAGASVSVDTDGAIVITFENGEKEVVKMPTRYTLYAVDQNNQPLAGVCLAVGYYSETLYQNVVCAEGRTDANGKVELLFAVEDGINYMAFNPMETADGDEAIPSGYTIDIGLNEWDLPIREVNLDAGVVTATLNYRDISSSFYYDDNVVTHGYQRTDEEGTVSDNSDMFGNYGCNTADIPAGEHRYVKVNPYNPYGDDADKVAATGKYRVSAVNADSGEILTNVVLKQFTATDAYCAVDDLGVPTAWTKIAGTAPAGTSAEVAALYTGTDYIEFEINDLNIGVTNYFALYSDTEVTVGIKVERVGDARTVTKTTNTPSAWSYGANYWANFSEYTLMPVDGSVTLVEDNNNIRVGNAYGSYVFVDFDAVIDRVSDKSISAILTELAGGSSDIINPFTVTTTTETESAITVTTNDYLTAMGEYLEMATTADMNGLYPVDTVMKKALQAYGNKTLSANEVDEDYRWLLPCYYYAAPTISVGSNTVECKETYANTASDIFTLNIETAGWYSVTAEAVESGNVYAVVYQDNQAAEKLYLEAGNHTIGLVVDTVGNYTINVATTTEPTAEITGTGATKGALSTIVAVSSYKYTFSGCTAGTYYFYVNGGMALNMNSVDVSFNGGTAVSLNNTGYMVINITNPDTDYVTVTNNGFWEVNIYGAMDTVNDVTVGTTTNVTLDAASFSMALCQSFYSRTFIKVAEAGTYNITVTTTEDCDFANTVTCGGMMFSQPDTNVLTYTFEGAVADANGIIMLDSNITSDTPISITITAATAA